MYDTDETEKILWNIWGFRAAKSYDTIPFINFVIYKGKPSYNISRNLTFIIAFLNMSDTILDKTVIGYMQFITNLIGKNA